MKSGPCTCRDHISNGQTPIVHPQEWSPAGPHSPALPPLGCPTPAPRSPLPSPPRDPRAQPALSQAHSGPCTRHARLRPILFLGLLVAPSRLRSPPLFSSWVLPGQGCRPRPAVPAGAGPVDCSPSCIVSKFPCLPGGSFWAPRPALVQPLYPSSWPGRGRYPGPLQSSALLPASLVLRPAAGAAPDAQRTRRLVCNAPAPAEPSPSAPVPGQQHLVSCTGESGGVCGGQHDSSMRWSQRHCSVQTAAPQSPSCPQNLYCHRVIQVQFKGQEVLETLPIPAEGLHAGTPRP